MSPATVTLRVDVPEPPEILAVLSVAEGPAGETVAVKATVSAKPFVGSTVMVDVPVFPSWIVSDVGVPEMVKSCAGGGTVVNVNVAVVECVSVPFVAVIVTGKDPATSDLQ